MENEQKKVLMICYAFPPAGGSAVHRPAKFAKYLPSFGWQPVVLTPAGKEESNEDSLQVPPLVHVVRTFSLAPANLKPLLDQAKKKHRSPEIIFIFATIILKLYCSIYYRLVLIDWDEGWVPFAVFRGYQIIRNEKVDLIYVHGQPPSSFVAGYLLQKFTHKPLVVDYDDPWNTSLHYAAAKKGIRRKIGCWLERKVLRASHTIISVKESTIRELRRAYDVDESKLCFLPNGYDPDDFAGTAAKPGREFHIVYTGTLSDKYCYSPESFIHALADLIREGTIPSQKVKVTFAGFISPRYRERYKNLITRSGLEEIVKHIGFVNHHRCIELMQEASVLLLLIESIQGSSVSKDFAGSIPAKIFDYIYTRIPICAIVPPGFESELIAKTGCGMVAEPNNVDSVENVLKILYSQHSNGTLKTEPDQDEINKYNRREQTRRLSELFVSVLLSGMT